MRTLAALTVFLALAVRLPLAAQDVLGVAEIGGLPGQTRDVPVTIRDLSGTLLDEGAGTNLEIQGFAFRLDFAPPEHVTAVTFVQAGVTAGHTPLFPIITPAADHIIVLMSFDEGTDPLLFALDAPPPGDLIGNLRFTLSAGAPLGTMITLTLAAASATLVNGAATLSETVANGHLALAAGSLLVTYDVFADGFENGDRCAWSASVPDPVCP
ncbi:MAG: hypothetical protein QG573_1343 [Acidobacteriota bacterium]|nr:hypothetical protein [Acidobacteriota bacterium]